MKKTKAHKPALQRRKSKNIVFERDAFTPEKINEMFEVAILDTQAIIDNDEGAYSQEVVDEAKLEIERIRDRKAKYNESLVKENP